MRYWVVFHYGPTCKGTGPTVFASWDRAIKFVEDYVKSNIKCKPELTANGVSIEDRKKETTFYIPIFIS